MKGTTMKMLNIINANFSLQQTNASESYLSLELSSTNEWENND